MLVEGSIVRIGAGRGVSDVHDISANSIAMIVAYGSTT